MVSDHLVPNAPRTHSFAANQTQIIFALEKEGEILTGDMNDAVNHDQTQTYISRFCKLLLLT